MCTALRLPCAGCESRGGPRTVRVDGRVVRFCRMRRFVALAARVAGTRRTTRNNPPRARAAWRPPCALLSPATRVGRDACPLRRRFIALGGKRSSTSTPSEKSPLSESPSCASRATGDCACQQPTHALTRGPGLIATCAGFRHPVSLRPPLPRSPRTTGLVDAIAAPVPNPDEFM